MPTSKGGCRLVGLTISRRNSTGPSTALRKLTQCCFDYWAAENGATGISGRACLPAALPIASGPGSPLKLNDRLSCNDTRRRRPANIHFSAAALTQNRKGIKAELLAKNHLP